MACAHHEQIQKDLTALFKMAIPAWLRNLAIVSLIGVTGYGVKTYVTIEEYNRNRVDIKADMTEMKSDIKTIASDIKDLIKAGK